MTSKAILKGILIFVIWAAPAYAQLNVPPKQQAGAKGNEDISLKNLTKDDFFTSAKGKFSIALPPKFDGFKELTPQTIGMNASGGAYEWKTEEAAIALMYFDYADKSISIETDKEFEDFIAGTMNGFAESSNAKVLAYSKITFGKYRGVKFEFRLINGLIGTNRTIWAFGRQYSLIAFFTPEIAEAEELISNVFNTFRITSQADIDEEMRLRIASSTPNALPQEPILPKPRSDAEDEGLKGKVQILSIETVDFFENAGGGKRKRSGNYYYSPKGFITKSEVFNSSGDPSEIAAYGFLNGMRISESRTVQYENGTVAGAYFPADDKKAGKEEIQFNTRYEYKYSKGRISELRILSKAGRQVSKYQYTYQGDYLEELVFDEQNKLAQKSISKLDSEGREIERADFEIKAEKAEILARYRMNYEDIDKKGNWTKQTTLKLSMQNGREAYIPWQIKYRTISYYP